MAVDGTTLQSWERYCPIGNCRLMVTWPYAPGNFSGAHHYVTVTARDHVGNVTTKKIEWDPTPPTDSASGELRSLANGYINGKGTRTVGISATDNHSGVRHLILEDEGQGVLVSQTPAACVFKVLRDEECPLETSETLTVDTSPMPEGANHLTARAEDFAENLDSGESWTVYVDRTGPSFPTSFEVTVINEQPWADPTVFLPTATDPPLPEGHAGSGVASEFYRYSLNGEPFTEWASNEFGIIEVPGAVAGDSVEVQAYAMDGVGNAGPTRSATVTVPPAVEEEGEEEFKEG